MNQDKMPDRRDPSKDRELYEGLRSVAFECSPAFNQLEPARYKDGQAIGAVMDFRVGKVADVTLYCCYEGPGDYVHVGLYTSGGFGVIGEHFPDKVFEAARAFLALTQYFLSDMTPTIDFAKSLDAETRFYAFTEQQVLTANVSPSNESFFNPLVYAAHSVIGEIQKWHSAMGKKKRKTAPKP